MKDLQGREYAKLSELRVGDKVTLDDGFTCQSKSTPFVTQHEVKAMPDGELYIDCEGSEDVESAEHMLDGQLACEHDDSLTGVYKVE